MLKISFATIVQSLVASPLFVAMSLVTPLISNQAHADGMVASDFIFQMDNAILRTPTFDLRKLLSGSTSVTLPDFVFQDKAPVQISGIQMNLNYQFTSSSDYPLIGKEVSVKSTNFSGQLKIDKIDVNAEIVVRENGTVAVGRLKANCTDTVVELLPGKAQISGSLAVVVGEDGLPTAQIPSLKVDWPEDAWIVRSLACTGARGFDGKVKKAVVDYLKKAESFQPRFQAFIDDQMLLYRLQIQNFFMQPIELPLGSAGITAVLNPQRLQAIDGDHFQVAGRLEVTFKDENNSDLIEIAGGAELPTQKLYTLAVPPQLVPALNDMAYKTGRYTRRVMGSAIQSFQDFRASGLAVAAVWPELGWYPREMDFAFDLSPSSPPLLQGLGVGSQGQLRGAISGALAIDVYSQKFNAPSVQYIAFDHFQANTGANLNASFIPTSAGSNLTINLASPRLSLTHAWDPSYPVRNAAVDVATISSKLEDSLAAGSYVMPIAPFALNSNTNLRASGFRQLDSWILVDFATH